MLLSDLLIPPFSTTLRTSEILLRFDLLDCAEFVSFRTRHTSSLDIVGFLQPECFRSIEIFTSSMLSKECSLKDIKVFVSDFFHLLVLILFSSEYVLRHEFHGHGIIPQFSRV